jgi:hypothetical protein
MAVTVHVYPAKPLCVASGLAEAPLAETAQPATATDIITAATATNTCPVCALSRLSPRIPIPL